MIEHAVATGPGGDPIRNTITAERPVIVATDGSSECDDAIELAHAFAEYRRSRLSAISVCEPVPAVYESLPPAPVFIPTDPGFDRGLRRKEVRDQLTRLLRTETRYTSYVTTGEMAREIIAYSDRHVASLIVTGRGRHGMLDRLLGEEHLGRLMRLAHCPVLAAEPTLLGVPYRVVVGVDFSASSLDLVRTAASLTSSAGTLHVIHVQPPPPSDVLRFRQMDSYRDSAQWRLEQLVAQAGHIGPTVETDVLMGHAAIALSAYAQHVKAEMIAVGTHGAGFFNRLIIGSTTTRLIRLASCSLLAVPGNEQPARDGT